MFFKFNSLFKRKNNVKRKGVHWKNIFCWSIAFLTFVLSLLGLVSNNNSSIVYLANNYSQYKTSTFNSFYVLEEAKAKIHEWNIDSNSNSFVCSLSLEINKCNDKEYVENLINHDLSNTQHNLIKRELKNVCAYFINNHKISSQFLTVNNLQPISDQLQQIMKNETIKLGSFVEGLEKQKNALGATGIVIAVILVILGALGMNWALFVPLTMLGLIGFCCGVSSDVISSLIYNLSSFGINNFNTYRIWFKPNNLNKQNFTQAIPFLLNYFKLIKTQLEENQGIFGAKQMLTNTNKNISQLEKILEMLNNSNS